VFPYDSRDLGPQLSRIGKEKGVLGKFSGKGTQVTPKSVGKNFIPQGLAEPVLPNQEYKRKVGNLWARANFSPKGVFPTPPRN